MKWKITLLLLFIVFSHTICIADSLWDPGFKGYLSSNKAITEGDVILVKINTNTKLSFVSSSKGNKVLTLEFTGGEYGKLFSFLPTARSSNSLKNAGEEEIVLETSVVTLVKSVNDRGNAFIEGTRSLEIDGLMESVTLTGILAPGSVETGGEVPFSRLADSKLVYRTLLASRDTLITEEDIAWALEELAGEAVAEDREASAGEEAAGEDEAPEPVEAEAGVEAPAETAGEEAPGAAESLSGGSTEPALMDAKKKELLIKYLNKLLDIIFK